MAEWFRRLPGFHRTPAGIERTVLRRLPRLLVFGSLLLALPSLWVRLAGEGAAPAAGSAAVRSVDLVVAGLLFLHWNLVLTVAIGAFIVMVMKGPAYAADAFPRDVADDADPPVPRSRG